MFFACFNSFLVVLRCFRLFGLVRLFGFFKLFTVVEIRFRLLNVVLSCLLLFRLFFVVFTCFRLIRLVDVFQGC